MSILDIIDKKRLKEQLTYDELSFAFNGYLNKNVKDYQMSSLLMAICINGMTDQEIFDLTDIFIKSGDVLDFSFIDGVKVDKHSTGGIGDKTTLALVPIVASLGIPVIKMSGRGLGYTGGTIDKLESIPGFNINLTSEEIISSVKNIGAVITGQTANLVPLDKVIYALRDVTATVSSISLIAVSIMSKKIAGGADKIVIDVKVGSGALIKNLEDAEKLSNIMVKIGEKYNREVRCIISDMSEPLGIYIGNSLEVIGAMNVLKNEGDPDLKNTIIQLASNMVSMAKGISVDDAILLVNNSIESGMAWNKFQEIVENQGGRLLEIPVSNNRKDILSTKSGKVRRIDALEVGKLSMALGAGRVNKEDSIDYSVGIKLNVKSGDDVEVGDVLCTLYLPDDPVYEINEKLFDIR